MTPTKSTLAASKRRLTELRLARSTETDPRVIAAQDKLATQLEQSIALQNEALAIQKRIKAIEQAARKRGIPRRQLYRPTA